jgi:hypothetical protein
LNRRAEEQSARVPVEEAQSVVEDETGADDNDVRHTRSIRVLRVLIQSEP